MSLDAPAITLTLAQMPSPPFRAEREGPAPKAWEGEVGAGERSGIPHLTPNPLRPQGRRGRVIAVLIA